MKTKLILAAIVLMALVYSCSDRDEQVYPKEDKTINKREQISSVTSKIESDSLKTEIILDAPQTQTQTQPGSGSEETVNPGSLGTPPTRP